MPLATLIVITGGAAPAVNTRFRSLPLWAILNVPVPKALAKPPVPLVPDVEIANLSAANPLMPPVAVAIFQVALLEPLKSAAVPLTSGETPESVQRLILNGSADVDAIVSGPPTLTRSHDDTAPAVPVADSICQL